MSFTKGEIEGRIKQSNFDAICRTGFRVPYPVRMKELITNYFSFEACKCDSLCGCKKFGCGGHWTPKMQTLTIDKTLLELFRGAFAQKHLGEALATGPRGRTAIYNLFSNKDIESKIALLWKLSSTSPKTLLCSCEMNSLDAAASDFWRVGVKLGISHIYLSKMLSFIFPDYFVPFDTKSTSQVKKDARAGKLGAVITLSPPNLKGYLITMTSIREFLVSNMPSWGLSIPALRNLSYLADDKKCETQMNLLKDDRPPTLSRAIDKIFYSPASNPTTRP